MYRADVTFTLFTGHWKAHIASARLPGRLYATGISLADHLYQELTGSEVRVKLVDVQVKKLHASFGALNM